MRARCIGGVGGLCGEPALDVRWLDRDLLPVRAVNRSISDAAEPRERLERPQEPASG